MSYWTLWARFFQGLYVTVCALFSIKVDSFERNRVVFVSYASVKGSASNSECERQDTLLISWAGSTFVVGGFPRQEFQNTLRTACERAGTKADMLFLTDPAQSFYLRNPAGVWDGGSYYATEVSKISKAYRKVICVGSSMGATGILLLHGRFPCDAAVVFNPLVDVHHEERLTFFLGGRRIPARLRMDIPQLMASQIVCPTENRRKCSVCVHVSRDSLPDQKQRRVLEDAVQTCCGGSPGESSSGKLHIVEHQCSEHVLPKQLHARNQLVPLLKDAIARYGCE